MASGYEGYIWAYFKSRLGNEFGTAGLMGNLKAESGLYPNRLEGDIPYSNRSVEYTSKVDSGEISEYDFVHSGNGYGLAQWTFSTRKQALYDMYKSGGYPSIGDITLACDYLWYELVHSYSSVLKVLMAATSVREASDMVLHDFENPADQSESVEISRAKMGTSFYNTYQGTSGNVDYTQFDIWISDAITWAVAIANDDTHGYDQGDRWGPDYDCSSLLISAFDQAGCPVKEAGASYSGDMEEAWIKLGGIALDFYAELPLVRGDILWREGHVGMYIGESKVVSAHSNENGETHGGQTGDQTGHEIDVSSLAQTIEWNDWARVFRFPTTGRIVQRKKGLSKLLLYAIATDRF